MTEAVPQVRVSAWRTAEGSKEDPSAPFHDCLWEMAYEQAILEYMKKHGVGEQEAAAAIKTEDVIRHLNTICDDNGFRRIDGSGTGRDPNLIGDGEQIKVRIDPKELTTRPDGLSAGQGSQTRSRYDAAKSNPKGQTDLNKKVQLDQFLRDIPELAKLDDQTQAALIDAYQRQGMDRGKLKALVSSKPFRDLPPPQQKAVLDDYGKAGHEATTAAIDKAVANAAANPSEKTSLELHNLLQLVGTPGFTHLSAEKQKLLLDKYASDGEFRQAIDTIVARGDFKAMPKEAQAHGLDVLRRYAGRKGEGYGERPVKDRPAVLVGLWEKVLSKPEFKLQEVATDGQETRTQTVRIDNFVDDTASTIHSK